VLKVDTLKMIYLNFNVQYSCRNASNGNALEFSSAVWTPLREDKVCAGYFGVQFVYMISNVVRV